MRTNGKFVCADTAWSDRADRFRRQFENLLRDTVRLSDRRVNPENWKKRKIFLMCRSRFPILIIPWCP